MTGTEKTTTKLSRQEVQKVYPKVKVKCDMEEVQRLMGRKRGTQVLKSIEVTRKEVLEILDSKPKTATGPDRTSYKELKRMDKTATFITALINHCIRRGEIPKHFTRSYLRFFPKGKKVATRMEECRTLGLQNCIHKIMTTVINQELQLWFHKTEQRSWCQFGFQKSFDKPSDGLREATAIHDAIIDDARRKKRELLIVYLDLQKAFYSIPHEALFLALRILGVEGNLLKVIGAIYEKHEMKDSKGFRNCFLQTTWLLWEVQWKKYKKH